MRGFRLGLLIAAAVSALAPAVGKAAYTSPSLYDCEPRDPNIAKPPPLPDLPPEVAALLPKAIESNEFKAVCPKGEVPEPTPIARIPKRVAPSLSAAGQEAGASRVRAGRRLSLIHI